MSRRHVIIGIVLSTLTLWFAGGNGAVSSRAAEVKALPPAAAPPLVAPAASQSYRQRTVGKPDPFRPFIGTDIEPKVKVPGKKETGKSHPLSPLQHKEISQFRLVGIAGDEKRRTAVVEDGVAKKIYPLHVGTYIGLNEGRVAEILSDRVIVEEKVVDEAKKGKQAQIRRIIVMLYKEE